MIDKPEKDKSRTPSTRNLVAMFKKLPTIDDKRAALRVLDISLREAEEEFKRKEAELAAKQAELQKVNDLLRSAGLSITDLAEFLQGQGQSAPLKRTTRRKKRASVEEPQDSRPADQQGDHAPENA